MSKHSFSVAPTIKFNRSRFPLHHTHKTTMNVGDLVPVYIEEVLPGDTFKLNMAFLSRLTSSFIKVPLDNLFMDVNFFFVPNRLIWSKWVNLMGENTEGYWANTIQYEVPKTRLNINSSSPSYVGTLADYFGVPYSNLSSAETIDLSQLPFRAFAKVWNDWYRNENTQAPVLFDGGSLDTSAQLLNVANWGPANIFGKPPKVSKFHDYFTSALPAPQKGSPVNLVFGDGVLSEVSAMTAHPVASGSNPLHWVSGGGGSVLQGTLVTAGNGDTGVVSSTPAITGTAQPDNLWANLGGLDTGISVNDIRYAFALQRMLETQARSGSRYTETIQGLFGVSNPDLRLQRSEYLGGSRTPLQFQQVAQTSQGSDDSPQANLSAYSQSAGHGGFIKSFGEYGYIIGVACIRQKHTYSQGIDKRLTRFTQLDFYNPCFANIGEQPIYQRELLYSSAVANYDGIFGYQEAWAEYRYHPDRVSGYMRPYVSQSLAQWSFADVYSLTGPAPVYNQSFLNETSEYVDRTLSVPSSSTPNFILDFSFKIDATRVMPTYSIPSLVDHMGRH